ncbi:MAG: SsrA-binding protein SmpB [Lachnospiraceae bacterium]|nr:SsrA-binding protein SmpB [Lachnospiraceae bacterium]
MKQTGKKLIANNKKAYHEYFIEETFECGIALVGTEVKSLRQGSCSLKEAFIKIRDHEAFVYGMHIAPYEKGNLFNKDPLRVRKLLLHKKEIVRLFTKTQEKGFTIVPLEVYFKDGLVKVLIALAKGKKLYDKREAIAKNDADREIERAVKNRNR